jgi:hypothetical protein
MKKKQQRRWPQFFFIFHFSFFILHSSLGRAIGAVVAQLLYTETVGGSNPSSPTRLLLPLNLHGDVVAVNSNGFFKDFTCKLDCGLQLTENAGLHFANIFTQ